MIPRYSLPEMASLWSDEARFSTMLEIEILATEAWSLLGTVPAEDVATIRERTAGMITADDVRAIEERERITNHDVAAFVDVVAGRVGQPAGGWVHYGLTSSDVTDTALSVTLSRAATLLVDAATALEGAIAGRARELRDMPMVGRTHGIHAEPTTMGAKLALWALQIRRDRERLSRARHAVSVGKLSGAVGTYSNVDPAVERYVCQRLGLRPVPATQVLARDRHAEFSYACAAVAASVEAFALEIRHLQRTEVGEAAEGFRKGAQKGSSAMPHKRNPVRCEQMCGLARVVRANLQAALENVALWHERDISHSSVERVILPDSFIALDHMLRRFTRIVRGMVVYPDRMIENLRRSRGVVFSGTVLLELARRGISREQAYEWVQRNAMRAFHESRDFKALLLQDADLMKVLTPAEVEKAFDLDDHFRNVDAIFDR
ncbi:MAG TPA: adenylosuccinate lyase, partial [Acidimicrobiia bacterium]|nr:adenylosuccinate lyase [Acidimicrobiia bacterium]